MDNNLQWINSRDELVSALEALGYPAELGDAIAKHIGYPKGIERMISYLRQVRPNKVELVVDEMISIRDEIDSWLEKKASQRANAAYTEMLNSALDDE
ncbi:MAG: hypothetical protein IK093_18975 [Ruminiclostridium sp.]|nr:hypothetical protein [Ruminiclostridium sp.]